MADGNSRDPNPVIDLVDELRRIVTECTGCFDVQSMDAAYRIISMLSQQKAFNFDLSSFDISGCDIPR